MAVCTGRSSCHYLHSASSLILFFSSYHTHKGFHKPLHLSPCRHSAPPEWIILTVPFMNIHGHAEVTQYFSSLFYFPLSQTCVWLNTGSCFIKIPSRVGCGVSLHSVVEITFLALMRSSLENIWQNPEKDVLTPIPRKQKTHSRRCQSVLPWGFKPVNGQSPSLDFGCVCVPVTFFSILQGQVSCTVPHPSLAPPLKPLTLLLPCLQKAFFHWVTVPASALSN